MLNFYCVLCHRLRGGELFDYISKKDYLTEEEAIDFTRQILQGLQHLHSRNVVHLDLKVWFNVTRMRSNDIKHNFATDILSRF